MDTYTSIEELFKEIASDKSSTVSWRYPIRFIFLSSVQSLRDIVKEFSKRGVDIIQLSNFLPHEDGWLTVDKIMESFLQIDSEKDYVILPFSELVRFFNRNDFIAIFNSLSGIENTRNKRRRFYIPLVGIFERFNQEFYSDFHRRTEWAPIWQLTGGESEKNRIYILNFAFDNVNHPDFIRNTTDWLNIWKNNDLSRLICSSRNLAFLCNNTLPDQVFDVEELTNVKDLLARVYQIAIPFPYVESESGYWRQLFEAVAVQQLTEMPVLLKNLLGSEILTQNEIIEVWLNSPNAFQKWLIKSYVISQEQWSASYIGVVMSSLDELDDLTLCKELWLNIFKLEKPAQKAHAADRKLLLREFYKAKPNFKLALIESELKTSFESIKNTVDKLLLLTDITESERAILLNLFSQGEITPERLVEKCDDLRHYLGDVGIDNLSPNSWIIDYFREYRLAKLRNEISSGVSKLLGEKNKSSESFYEWYYSIQSVEEILIEENIAKVFLIDALGLEWLPFLNHLLRDIDGLHIAKKYVGRVKLPSVTECNKLPNSEHIRDFDRDIIHSDYKYPETPLKQLVFLADIVRKHIYIHNSDKIAITADHGTTALARLDNHLKTYTFSDSSHEGRCMWLAARQEVDDSNMLLHEIDNPTSEQKKFSLVALNYTSLHQKSKREAHGGGTPEEVLVPVIIVSKDEIVSGLAYAVSPMILSITKRNPLLSVQIEPLPKDYPQLVLNDKEIGKLKYNADADRWYIKLDKLKSGAYKMVLKIDSWQGQIDVEIKGGMQESELL